MLTTDQTASVRPLETADDLDEARLEAIGYIFHGSLGDGAPKRVKAGSNTLHFARCGKLDKAGADESKVWYRTINIAKRHLDEHVGLGRWQWCKVCVREVTQKLINEQ